MGKIMEAMVACTFFGLRDYNEKYDHQIATYILDNIKSLSWYFKVSLVVYIYFIGFIALLVKLKPLKKGVYHEYIPKH